MTRMLLTDKEQKHVHDVVVNYEGDGEVLEKALGALIIGKAYGFKVIRVMHGNDAYARYQRILDLRFNEWCEPETSLSDRHQGYKLIGKLENFWKIIRRQDTRPSELKQARKVFG